MILRLKRRVAVFLVAMVGFAQLTAAHATCPMESGAMAAMMSAAQGAPAPCGGCDTPLDPRDLSPSLCASACATSDQPASVAAAFSVPAPVRAVLVLERVPEPARPSGLDGPPSGAPPHRILQHAFLI